VFAAEVDFRKNLTRFHEIPVNLWGDPSRTALSSLFTGTKHYDEGHSMLQLIDPA